MKRCVYLLLAVAFLSPSAVRSQTVDEIIAKNAQARGGIEKLRAIKSVRITARLSQGTFRATYVQENKRADKVREETIIQGMAQIQAYDGKSAWQINPFGGRKDPELMSADDTKQLILDSDLEGFLIDYKEKGHKAELVGHDSVEGTDCYKIKLTLKDGDVRYYYLDADSYLEIKIETQSTVRGAVVYTDTMLGDYEQVDGVFFPFSVEAGESNSPSDQHIRLSIEKVEINPNLDDTRFSVPAKPAAAK
ncbi:MAG TPA: outer membrane lipoprotein-sorting protein [Dongiaceae bacterium]|nr:outer membrane lipoprotein-sorting protein [Dongiaceae bacterium]